MALRALILAIPVALIATSTAGAATVSASKSELRYNAGPGEVNVFTVSRYLDETLFTEDRLPLVAGKGCVQLKQKQVLCVMPVAPRRVIVNLRDGNDFVRVSYLTPVTLDDLTSTVKGGDGDDIVYTGDGNDKLLGGSGDDRLLAQFGDDRLNGEGGADYLFGGAGDDVLRGGAGIDLLDDPFGSNQLKQ